MLILNSPQITQETCLRWKKENTLAFVPTMGCLHEGHLELIKKARTLASKVIVSIFVNPLQFGPNEDFAKYPREFDQDCEKLEKLEVDLVFHPSAREFYPEGFATHLTMGKITERLCGQFRPGHFDGVATVVLKLLQTVDCDFALFGQKDFQQLRVIEQLTRDLNLAVSIVPHPIVRDHDQVALSSRNSYLSTEERNWATKIPQALELAHRLIANNPQLKVSDLLTSVRQLLLSVPLKIQYVEITEGPNLSISQVDSKLLELNLPHLFIAVYAGTTRLIDNSALKPMLEV